MISRLLLHFAGRGLLASIALLSAAAPAGSFAQVPEPRPKRVAIIQLPSEAPFREARKAWAERFAKHGLVDGRDIEIAITLVDQEKFLKGDWNAAVTDAVRQAAALRPAVIVVWSDDVGELIPAARGVPLVAWSHDVATAKSLEALNRRGENVTGIMYSYLELVTMRFGLMKELRPGARRAAILVPQGPQRQPTEKEEAGRREYVAHYESNLRKLGLEFTRIELPRDSSAEVVIAALRKARIDLVEVVWHFGPGHWEPLAKNGIPASGAGTSAKDGALLSGWTAGILPSVVRLASRIVRGARAPDLPVERATEFNLAINLSTARTLGVTVPPSMLIRADQVFE